MKILLTNFHNGRGGGHDTYVVSLARALAGRHEVFIGAPRTSRLLQHASAVADIRALPMEFPAKLKELGRFVGAIRELRTLLKQERFDVVHMNGSPDHRLVMLATLFASFKRPYFVYTKHNTIRVKRDFMTKLKARRATHHVIAVSQPAAKLLEGSVYADCGMSVIANGVDIDFYAPFDDALAARRREALLGVAHAGKLVVGTITGFDWYKGTMDMVAAVAALPEEMRKRVVLVVAGTEPNDAQREVIESLNMSDNLLVTGFTDDVRGYVATFDVGFMVSYAVESSSFACREMMSMGRPVLVTRYASLPDNVDDGVDGWIVEPRDTHAMTARLQIMLENRGRLCAMGLSARAKAEREFCNSKFIRETEQVYVRAAP
ncbi:glycosyltransferase family 4 protein [Paraburkholderia phymatum]|uniref:Glycosyl transferase group 1 n=1 Tax=Paraburkholderia phymatum (strain DSM 17167 / CIP 108236 / LMG 21445 / STM815) TaxID=391038 RepID=B2JEZ3_PARP8|nr:glycosyltransferase family 4 protein [Paraburkholderia phymatum]ACC69922.1 glycosyl transferase group 1 [Paraburkholderia phymatum STM815]